MHVQDGQTAQVRGRQGLGWADGQGLLSEDGASFGVRECSGTTSWWWSHAVMHALKATAHGKRFVLREFQFNF